MNLIIFRNRKLAIRIFVITSILMLVSLFTCIGKVIGVFMTLWIISIFWNMWLMFKAASLTPVDFVNHIEKEIDNTRNKKKPFRKGFYYIIIPFIIVGLIIVCLDLFAFFVLL